MILTPPDNAAWGTSLRRWAAAEKRLERGEVGEGMRLKPFEIWRSRDFLVQFFLEGEWVRMTVNRTDHNGVDDWIDGISWDELQRLKSETGRGNMWAVELYPPDAGVVNDANMRHLWLVRDPPPFAWGA